jgi:hypothetical protein
MVLEELKKAIAGQQSSASFACGGSILVTAGAVEGEETQNPPGL